MKLHKLSKITLVIFTLMTILLSACGGSAPAQEPAPSAPTQPPAEAAQPAAAPAEPQPEAASAVEPINTQNAARLKEVGHWGKGRINSLVYSKDGKSLFVGTSIAIFIYDTSTWAESRMIDTGTQSLYSMAISPDGNTLASGSTSGVIQLFQVSDGKLINELSGHTDAVTALAFSPDGQTIASVSADMSLRFWNVSDGTSLMVIEEPFSTRINCVGYSPDGSMIAVGTDLPDNKTLIWKKDAQAPFQVLEGHTNAISDLAFAADNATIATASRDSTIRLWDIVKGTELKAFKTEDLPEFQKPTATPSGEEMTEEELQIQAELDMMRFPFTFSLSLSPDGQSAVGGYFDGSLRIWNINDGTLTRTIKGHKSLVFNTIYSPDGKFIASRSNDGTVKIWQAADGAEVTTLVMGIDISSIAYSPDGNNMLVGGEANEVDMRQVSDGALIRQFIGHIGRITKVAFSPDGSLTAASGIDYDTYIWQTSDGKNTLQLPSLGLVLDTAFSPDGKSIASAIGGVGAVGIWNVSDGILSRSLTEHEGSALRLAFSPDSTILAAADSGNSIKLWFIEKTQQLASLTGHLDTITGLAFSPSGETLVSAAADMSVRIWEIPSGKELKTLQLGIPIASLAYSKDGTILAAGMVDGTIVILDPNSSKPETPLVVLAGHKLDVTTLDFSPDGNTLASGSKDGTIRFWQVQ